MATAPTVGGCRLCSLEPPPPCLALASEPHFTYPMHLLTPASACRAAPPAHAAASPSVSHCPQTCPPAAPTTPAAPQAAVTAAACRTATGPQATVLPVAPLLATAPPALLATAARRRPKSARWVAAAGPRQQVWVSIRAGVCHSPGHVSTPLICICPMCPAAVHPDPPSLSLPILTPQIIVIPAGKDQSYCGSYSCPQQSYCQVWHRLGCRKALHPQLTHSWLCKLWAGPRSEHETRAPHSACLPNPPCAGERLWLD